MEYAVLSCDHTKIERKNNNKWKVRVNVAHWLWLLDSNPQVQGSKPDPLAKIPPLQRERPSLVWRWWVLFAVCLQVFFCGVFAGCFASFKLARPAFPQRQQVRGPTLLPTSKIFIISASLWGFGLFCFLFLFFFLYLLWKSSAMIIHLGFVCVCVCVCVFVWFLFYFPLWDFDCTLRNYVCSRRKKCWWNEERERGGGGGNISTSTTKGNIIISRVFVSCFVKWCPSFSRFQWQEGVPIVGEFKA